MWGGCLHWRQQIWRISSKTIILNSPAAAVSFLLKFFVLIFSASLDQIGGIATFAGTSTQPVCPTSSPSTLCPPPVRVERVPCAAHVSRVSFKMQSIATLLQTIDLNEEGVAAAAEDAIGIREAGTRPHLTEMT
jgi:hypothetical protein